MSTIEMPAGASNTIRLRSLATMYRSGETCVGYTRSIRSASSARPV